MGKLDDRLLCINEELRLIRGELPTRQELMRWRILCLASLAVALLAALAM